jgi:hypothetical protein
LTQEATHRTIHSNVKSILTPKAVTLVFLGAAVFYFASFYGLEYVRHRRGPWELSFRADAQGAPHVLISQSALGLTEVKLVFHGEHATGVSGGPIRFDRVDRAPSCGRLIYHDLTFLPGVLTFDFFGHEIELLPRVLVINKKEIPWRSGDVIDLWPTNKPAQPPRPPKVRS